MKTVDDFADLVPFQRIELHASEQENYEGEWLVNLPSGRTLEFARYEDAADLALEYDEEEIHFSA